MWLWFDAEMVVQWLAERPVVDVGHTCHMRLVRKNCASRLVSAIVVAAFGHKRQKRLAETSKQKLSVCHFVSILFTRLKS